MKEPKECRCVFPKPITYDPRVKTGNWFENQHIYKRDNFKHTSEYLREYYDKPLTTNPRSVKWDITLKAEGNTGIYPPRTSDASPNFHDNFSTSYHLSYGHFPKISPPIVENAIFPIRKIGHPRSVPELIESYGNITNYGLVESKKDTWKCQQTKRRTTSSTLTQADYYKPDKGGYNFRRWPRYRAIPKKTADIYPPLPDDHPKLPKCNPLSWEPRKKDEVPPNYQLDCS